MIGKTPRIPDLTIVNLQDALNIMQTEVKERARRTAKPTETVEGAEENCGRHRSEHHDWRKHRIRGRRGHREGREVYGNEEYGPFHQGAGPVELYSCRSK